MKKITIGFLLLVSVAVAQSETLNLGGRGKLTFYFTDAWKVSVADFADRKIVTVEPVGDVNASATITVTFPERDDFASKRSLKQRVEIDSAQFEAQSVEGKAVAKEFSLREGFGFYCQFTDPELIGKPPQKGNYKGIAVGRIRLAADVMVEVSLQADGFKSAAFQDQLGMIEGMEFTARR